MYSIQVEDHFDSAHFLKDYNGKCKNIHGHRWTVQVGLEKESLEESGDKRAMLVDFGEIKEALKEITQVYDHSLIYEKGTLAEDLLKILKREEFYLVEVGFRPTAENFAYSIFSQLKAKNFPLAWVKVFETPTNVAMYKEDKNEI